MFMRQSPRVLRTAFQSAAGLIVGSHVLFSTSTCDDSSSSSLKDRLERIEAAVQSFTDGESRRELDFSVDEEYPGRVISKELYKKLAPLQTERGENVDKLLQPCLDSVNPLQCGSEMIVGDLQSYDVFSELFDFMVSYELSGMPLHPGDDKEDWSALATSDKVKRLSFTTQRNLDGVLLPAKMSRALRNRVNRIVNDAVANGMGALGLENGYCMSFTKEEDPFCSPAMLARGLHRDWPQGRSLVATPGPYNGVRNIIFSINLEDHLQIVAEGSLQDPQGSFLGFARILDAVSRATSSQGFKFSYRGAYGFLSARPTKTSLAPDVTIELRLPLCAQDPLLPDLIQERGLTFTRLDDGERIEISASDSFLRTKCEKPLFLDGPLVRALNGAKYLLDLETQRDKSQSTA